MLREYVSVIAQCRIVSEQSNKVASHFMRFLTTPELRAKITGTLEVETQGWTLKEISLDDTLATMAYDGNNVRCLSIKIGRAKPVSVLITDFETVERVFNHWAAALLETYVGRHDFATLGRFFVPIPPPTPIETPQVRL